jgi:CheY-like chemotaxis protein/AraC-like DNA-binding protein
MRPSVETRASRFALVTAGHRFLIEALPPQRPKSLAALETFVAAIRRINPLPADLEAVLLRCLAVLNMHTSGRIPSLVDMYLSTTSSPADYLSRFSHCVEERLRYEGIRDGSVQEALDCIKKNHASPSCTPQAIAASRGLRLSALDVAFKRETGRTLTERIRDERLEHASILLATTNKSIKEVWAQVGYNHHSNFDHDFKARFGVPPREYRARTLRPEARVLFGDDPWESTAVSDRHAKAPQANVLIVDDDEGSRTTLAAWLHHEGHSVAVAESGGECLAQVRRHSPDAILLDYHLGDMDGVDCLRSLREWAPGHVPAVAIFTADWDVLDRSAEVAELDAMVASKLCDLERVSDLLVYLTSNSPARQESDTCRPSWRPWVSFL